MNGFLPSGCICTVPGCASRQFCRGVCNAHYQHLKSATSDGVKTGSVPKLTDADVAKIRRLNAAMKTRTEIAADLGVTVKVVRKVLAGQYRTVEQKAAEVAP